MTATTTTPSPAADSAIAEPLLEIREVSKTSAASSR